MSYCILVKLNTFDDGCALHHLLLWPLSLFNFVASVFFRLGAWLTSTTSIYIQLLQYWRNSWVKFLEAYLDRVLKLDSLRSVTGMTSTRSGKRSTSKSLRKSIHFYTSFLISYTFFWTLHLMIRFFNITFQTMCAPHPPILFDLNLFFSSIHFILILIC